VFFELFGELGKKAGTKGNISAAWRGTGLAPYSLIAVLKWLSTWEKVGVEKVAFSTSSDPPHGVKPTLPDPKTLKSGREIENLFVEAKILHTVRLDGLLESPINVGFEKLCKATIQACPETDVQRETNKAYEGRKEKENGGKKVLSKARRLSQEGR